MSSAPDAPDAPDAPAPPDAPVAPASADRRSRLAELGRSAATLALPAGGTLVRTALGMGLLGVALAYLAYRLALPRAGRAALLPAALVLVGTCAASLPLALKRALGRAVLEGVRRFRLAAQVVRLLFERLLGISDGAGEHGERGGGVARALERLPLAQAEAALREAVASWRPPDGGKRSWLGRRIEARLLATVEQLTLARFRDHAARHGGVDLVRVRDELVEAVDAQVAERVRGALRTLTVTVLVALVAAAVLLGYGGGMAIAALR